VNASKEIYIYLSSIYNIVRKEYMCLPLPSLFIYSSAPHDNSADSVNLPTINQSPSFYAASWNSSTNIVLSFVLSHIYQHENELKHYFIKYKTCIVHFWDNAAH
jgi:hypothetical protein